MVTGTKRVNLTSQYAFSLVKGDLNRTDFSVVVKNRARTPKPWRWEIYCAGRRSPIARSNNFFELRSTASLESHVALDEMLRKLRF